MKVHRTARAKHVATTPVLTLPRAAYELVVACRARNPTGLPDQVMEFCRAWDVHQAARTQRRGRPLPQSPGEALLDAAMATYHANGDAEAALRAVEQALAANPDCAARAHSLRYALLTRTSHGLQPKEHVTAMFMALTAAVNGASAPARRHLVGAALGLLENRLDEVIRLSERALAVDADCAAALALRVLAVACIAWGEREGHVVVRVKRR